VNFLGRGFQKSEHYKHTDTLTDASRPNALPPYLRLVKMYGVQFLSSIPLILKPWRHRLCLYGSSDCVPACRDTKRASSGVDRARQQRSAGVDVFSASRERAHPAGASSTAARRHRNMDLHTVVQFHVTMRPPLGRWGEERRKGEVTAGGFEIVNVTHGLRCIYLLSSLAFYHDVSPWPWPWP